MSRWFWTLFGDDMPGRFRLLGAGVVAVVALMALGATLVYRTNTTNQFREQTKDNCKTVEALKSAILLVFQDGRQNLEARKGALTASEYARLDEYYKRQFARFAPKPC